jgi:uncharacterized protein (DUF983 family)
MIAHSPGNPPRFRISSIFKARCPACHQGPILRNGFGIHRRCSICDHDFFPEPGFYLGAMAVAFLLTAMLTIPPTIVLKLLDVEVAFLVTFPLIEFIFLGTFLMIYSRVLWLHLEYRTSHRLDGTYVHYRQSSGSVQSEEPKVANK